MRRVILAVVSTVVGLVLLLTFKTHSISGASGSAPPAAISTPSGGATGAASAPASGGSTAGGSTAGGSTAGVRTVTGAAVSTMYGPVQVQIMVKGGHITAAKAVQYPQTFQQDQQINAYAIPELNREAVTAGSAKIDMVSGATYTSRGYISSLQSALDQAKIGA